MSSEDLVRNHRLIWTIYFICCNSSDNDEDNEAGCCTIPGGCMVFLNPVAGEYVSPPNLPFLNIFFFDMFVMSASHFLKGFLDIWVGCKPAYRD